MRTAQADDVPAIIEHVMAVHGEEVVNGVRAMYAHHPRKSWEDCFLIVDERSGTVVSSLILLPGSWMLDGVEVPVAQMEAVGTLKEYRNRGLIHKLNVEFEKRIEAHGSVVQVIAGIPNFYRSFGYEYGADLGGGFPVAPSLVPKLPEGEDEPVEIEAVDQKGLKGYLAYREQAMPPGTWVKAIKPADFKYYNFDAPNPKTEGWFFHVVRENSKIVGIFILSRWESRLDIIDLYLDSFSHVDSVLRFALSKSEEYGGHTVRVAPPNQSQIWEFVQARTGTALRHRYSWYVKIPSVERFLQAIAPVLRKRLCGSDYKDFVGELKVTDYKQGLAIQIDKCNITEIREMAEKDPGGYDLRLPHGALTRLVMGYETIDELQSHEPDTICRASMLPLVRALFPKLRATVDPFY